MSNNAGFGRDAEEFLRQRSAKDGDNVGGYGIRVTAIVPSGDSAATVRLTVTGCGGSEESEHILLMEHVKELSLEIGEIKSEIAEDIEYYASVARGYYSAMSSFAYAPSSLRALENKLINKDFDRDVAHEAVGIVRSRGYIDECAIAVRRAQILAEKKWGRSRIVSKLREEGFGPEALRCGVEELEQIDFAENCAEIIRKKFGELPEEPRERNKALASLSRMGYGGVDIRRALKLLKSE